MATKGDFGRILSGIPIQIQGANVAMTQPTVRQICAFGEDEFFLGVNLFLNADLMAKDVREGNSRLAMLSDFQVLIVILQNDITAKQSFQNLFDLIFPGYVCSLAPGCIEFRVEEKGRMVGRLDPMNFESFQNCLKTLFLPADAKDSKEYDYNPSNSKAAEIAEKFKKADEKRRAMRAKKENDNAPSSLFAVYTSSLAIGLGIDINILFEYTPFQLYDAFTRYHKKVAYDMYQKVSTTPMMDVSKMEEPEMWFNDLYKQ